MAKYLFPALCAAVLIGSALPAAAQETASRKDVLRTTAIIESVDHETRQFLLTGENGRTLSLVAGPEVVNFDQLDDGDRVTIDFVESVAVVMAEPGEEGAVTATVAGRAPEGQRPGLAVGEVSTFVVEFVSYDPASHIVTFIRPNGEVAAIRARPEMWDFASKRKSGDRVEVMIERALAIAVTPIDG